MKISIEQQSSFKKKLFWVNPHKLNLFSAPPNWWWYARLDKYLQNKILKTTLKKIAMDKLYYNGDWDLNAKLFVNTDWAKNIRSLMPDYNNYKFSLWYKSILCHISTHGFYKYKKNLIVKKEQIDFFFENIIIKLIRSIINNGFIVNDENSIDIPKVLISRNGDLIKSGNGCHRLAIIKELNLQHKYPVQIIGIHKKFTISGTHATALRCVDISNFISRKFSNIK